MPHARIFPPPAGRLAALAAVLLTGCVADPAAPPPSAAKTSNPLLEPVQMQEYVPGGGASTRRSASSGQTPAQTQNEAQAQSDGQTPSDPAASNRRRGSGTAPDQLAPPSVPAGPTTVQPKSTTSDTARFKRDLLQPGVTEMQRKDSLGRLDPFQQRDLLNKQHELHRLETDPLRR